MTEQYEVSYAKNGNLYTKIVMALSKEQAEKNFLDNHNSINEEDIRSVYRVEHKKTTHYTYGDLKPIQIFCLPVWVQDFIKKYPAHPNERAFAKNIPVTEENMAIIKRIAQVIPIIRRWRGSSRFLGEIGKSQYYCRPIAYCQKQGAERVSLYYRERI
jgi:hypothetical protein